MNATNYSWISLLIITPFSLTQDWVHDRTQTTIATTMGQEIYISNPYGDIHLRSKDGTGLEIITHYQAEKKAQGYVKYLNKVENGVLYYQVLFPDDEKTKNIGKRRVDLTFFIPKHSKLIIVGQDGVVKGKGLNNPMTVTTHNGNVSLRNAQPANITTYQGDIDYFIHAESWENPINLESKIGNITLWLSESSTVKVSASSKGDIASDFSTTITSEKDQLYKSASIKLRSGDATVSMHSVQGNLRIKKQVKQSSY